MSLYARITDLNAPNRILVHRFGAALRQFAAGQLTRAQIIATFTLTGSDITELDAMIATYQALGTGTADEAFIKANYLNAMEDVFYLSLSGDYPEAKAKSALGF